MVETRVVVGEEGLCLILYLVKLLERQTSGFNCCIDGEVEIPYAVP